MITREWVAQKLEESGKKKNKLAEALGLDPSIVTRMLSGERRISQAEAETIKNFFEDAVEEKSEEDDDTELDIKLLETAIESAFLLTRHVDLTFAEIAEQAAGAYAKAIKRRRSRRVKKPD